MKGGVKPPLFKGSGSAIALTEGSYKSCNISFPPAYNITRFNKKFRRVIMDSDFMSNLANMLKNGNIPDDMKSKMSEFMNQNSRTKY